MKIRSFATVISGAIMLVSVSAAASDGLERLQVMKDPTSGELIPVEAVNGQSTGPGQVTGQSAIQGVEDLYVIKSLRGLKEAKLPVWAEQDILRRKGFSGWMDVPAGQIDDSIAPITINLSAIRQLELIQNNSIGAPGGQTNPDDSGDKQLAPGVIGSVQPQGFCLISSGKWKDKQYTKSLPYKLPSQSYKENKSGTYFSGAIDATFNAEGQLRATVNYAEQSKCGVTYEYEFRSVDVALAGGFDGAFLAQGDMKYEKSFELWRKNLTLLTGNFDLNSGYVNVEVEYDVTLDLALNAAIKASATASLDGYIKGSADVVYRCYENKPCETIKNNYSYSFDSNDRPLQAGIEVEAKLVPSADLKLATDVDLYWGLVQVLKGEIGIVGALPITAWGYAGNTCSDVTGDGKSDFAAGFILDVSGEVYAYFGYTYLDKKSKRGLDVPLSGFSKRIVDDSRFDGGKRPVRVKNLFYKDLLGTGKSNTMQPIVSFPAEMGPGSDLKISPRKCYPFKEQVTYLIQWPDGSRNQIDTGTIKVPMSQSGSYPVKVKAVKDSASRDLNSGWTERTVKITSGAPVHKVEESTHMDWLTQGFTYIRSAWALDHSLHAETGAPQAGQAPTGWWSSHWDFKAIEGGEFVKITNRWHPSVSLHMENGKLEGSDAPDGWWSAHWIIEPVPGVADTYRLRNRWHSSSYINMEGMTLKSSDVPQNYMSSWWRFPKIK